MAAFNDSYQKLFLGTKLTTANANQVTGFIVTAGLKTDVLQVSTGVAATDYGVGSWGLFDASTWASVTTASLGAGKQSLVLAAASMQANDKISPFLGGYKESNKSKDINPKLVNRFVRIDPCTARQQTIHVGTTKYTKTLSPTNSACCFKFLCGTTYNLRIEVKNEPMYRFLNHSGIRLLEFNSGCCPDGAPLTYVDPTLAMIAWANAIISDPILASFISPIVYSQAGVALYAPGTVGAQYTWDNYVTVAYDGTKCGAGLRLQAAYYDTVFGNCSFQPTDYFNTTPIEIFASMVDFNGDPCSYTGICVINECQGLKGNGFGETVLRDMILSESYRQNNFPTDIRMREIEQGSDIINNITRANYYTRYIVQHTVPRPNNPSGTYSADQYTLEIITNGTVAAFETLMTAWLGNANSSVTLETTSCGTCTPLVP